MAEVLTHGLTLLPAQGATAAKWNALRDAWTGIRDEALAARQRMRRIADGRVRPGMWHVLPLLAEPEDRAVWTPEFCMRCREAVPRTAALVDAIPGIHACTFSSLAPRGHIRPHRHRNPFLTVSLCLQSGGDSSITVAGQRAPYRDGEFLVFDYRQEHEVINEGDAERIVLLLLVDHPRP